MKSTHAVLNCSQGKLVRFLITLLILSVIYTSEATMVYASPPRQEPANITVAVVAKDPPGSYNRQCTWIGGECRYTLLNTVVYPFDTVGDSQTYIRHVLQHEILFDYWQWSARYANAVAARTRGWWAVLNRPNQGRHLVDGSILPGDITDTTWDQAVGPINETTASYLNQATDTTHGQVIRCCGTGAWYDESAGDVRFNEFRGDSTNPTGFGPGNQPPNISVLEPVPGGTLQGVGLSQNGSQRLAADPRYWTYYQILAHYYSVLNYNPSTNLPKHRANFTDYAFPGSSFTMGTGAGCSFALNVQNTGQWTWTTTDTGEGKWVRWGYTWYYYSNGAQLSGSFTYGQGGYYDYRTSFWMSGQSWASPGDTVIYNTMTIYAPYAEGTYILRVSMVHENVAWFYWEWPPLDFTVTALNGAGCPPV